MKFEKFETLLCPNRSGKDLIF